jgi:Ni/Co efflux regulator RcnB
MKSPIEKLLTAILISGAIAAPSALAQNSNSVVQDERAHRLEHERHLHLEKETRQMHDRLAKDYDQALHRDLKEGNRAAATEEAMKISQQDQDLHKDKSEIQLEKHYVKKDNHVIKQKLKQH